MYYNLIQIIEMIFKPPISW